VSSAGSAPPTESPNFSAWRARRGLTRIDLWCAAATKSNPDPQVWPRRCMRAGETHRADGVSLNGASYPYNHVCVLPPQNV
jgi:hypothetical protein